MPTKVSSLAVAALAAASLFGSSAAAPLALGSAASSEAELVKSDTVDSSAPQLNITYSSNYTEHLPRTLILATGCAFAPSLSPRLVDLSS